MHPTTAYPSINGTLGKTGRSKQNPHNKKPVAARLLAALLTAIVVLLSACTGGPTPTSTWSLRGTGDEPDGVTATVPPGWYLEERDPKAHDVRLSIILKEPAGADSFAGITIMNRLPGIAMPPNGPDDVENYLHERRDRTIKYRSIVPSAQHDVSRDLTMAVPLPDRTIDGYFATGLTGFYHNNEEVYPVQLWFVWRNDGIWEIWASGLLGADEVPPEIIDAVDTIHWTPLTPTTTPSPGK